MERRALRSLLMDRCVWRAALPVLLALTVTLAALTVWNSGRAPGPAVELSETAAAGRYAALSVASVSDSFARSGGVDLYFLSDDGGYLYVARMTRAQQADLRAALADGARPRAAGMTVTASESLRRVACGLFPGIPVREYDSYFGPAYLDCTLTPYSALDADLRGWLLALALLSMGVFFLWLRRRLTVEGCLLRLAQRDLTAEAAGELRSAGADRLLGPLAVTGRFLCDARRGVLYARDELAEPLTRRGRFFVRLRARVGGGRRRTVTRLPARRADALEELLRGPVRGPELKPGAFQTPVYWEIPGEEH